MLAHVRPVKERCALKLTAAAALLATLSANRPPPKWWAYGKVALAATERCATVQLDHFGKVRVERGDEPEGGAVRLFLLAVSKPESQVVVTLYLDGDTRFTTLAMDSDNQALGAEIWRSIKRNCGVS